MDMNLERISKEVVIAYFQVMSQHLPGGTEENNKTTTARIASFWTKI
jgi:hypothetical protein